MPSTGTVPAAAALTVLTSCPQKRFPPSMASSLGPSADWSRPANVGTSSVVGGEASREICEDVDDEAETGREDVKIEVGGMEVG